MFIKCSIPLNGSKRPRYTLCSLFLLLQVSDAFRGWPITPRRQPKSSGLQAPIGTITSQTNHHPSQSLPAASLSRWTRLKTATSASTTSLILLDKTVALASLSAIAKVLASIGLGALATRRPNLLDQQALSVLSRLTYWIFQPAFLLCSVGQTLFDATSITGGGVPGGLSPSLLTLLPLVAFIQVSMGAVVGLLWTRPGRFSRSTALEIRMCSTFANSGPLPLIFANSLFASNTGLLNEIAACISFYLLAWSPLFWTLGRVLLGITPQGSSESSATAPSRWKQLEAQLQLFLSPPVVGCLLGIILGGIPWWNGHVFGKNAILSPLLGACKSLGTAYLPAALLVLAGSLVGSPTKPSTTKVNSSSSSSENNSAINSQGLTSGSSASLESASPPALGAVGAIGLCRWVLAPLLSYGLVQILNVAGAFAGASRRAQAVVTFVILLEACTPPAQNAVVMLQLENQTGRAQQMARLLTILYTISVVPITILLSACLAMSGILNFVQ